MSINCIRNLLQELNLPKGARVGLYTKKDVSQVTAILAILSTDYILVPLTRLLKPEQVQYIIDDCEIQCVITDNLKLESIEEINFSGHVISIETVGKDIPSFEEIFKYYNKPFNNDINGLNENDVICGLLIFNLDYGLNQIFCSLLNKATLALHRFILPGDFFSSGGNVTEKMIDECSNTFRQASFFSMHGLTEAFRSTYLDPSQIKIHPSRRLYL